MFQMTKIWVDAGDRVDSVEIRYTWSSLGEPPKWGGNEEAEVMTVIPNTNPRVRQAVIEIPRYLIIAFVGLFAFAGFGAACVRSTAVRILLAIIIVSLSANMSFKASVVPLYGTWIMSTPSAFFRIEAEMFAVEPFPSDP